MKKFLKFLFFVILILVGLGIFAYYKGYDNLVNRWINFSFCDSPLYYKVGIVDPEFEISKEEIVKNTKEAGQIWNDVIGKDLFIYNEDANLTVSLIFDERQGTLQEISEKKNEIDEKKDNLVLSIEEFEQKRQNLENQLTELNQEIEYWNNKGGAKPDKFRELTNKQDFLRDEIAKINKTADSLNRASEKINNDVDYVNKKVESFNDLLSVLPEEGVYMAGPHKIEIYLYDSEHSYQHTVAHELGHALGLDHVDEEESILYPVSSPNSRATESDLQAISTFCAEHNRLDLIKNDIKHMIFSLLTELDFVVT